jgi:PAS domain S-box-containing protein
MATSGKDRQRKYKERLRILNKKAVAVDFSKEAYEILVRNTKKTGKNYAEIIDELLMGIQEHEEILRNIPLETGRVLHNILTYFDNFKEKQVDEGIKHARHVFQSLDTGEVMNKHDDATERYFNDLLEHSYDTIFRFNYIENRFDYISTTSSKEMSKTVREMKTLGSDTVLAEFIHPEDLQKVLGHYSLSKTTCLDDISPTIEYRGKVGGKDGTYRWISATHKIIRDKDNRPVAVIGIAREINESKELEIELRQSND